MAKSPVCKAFGLDEIYCIDFETVWGAGYTLKSTPTTEYVYDPRFAVHCVAVKASSWAKPRVFTPAQFIVWAKTVAWARVGVLAHHAQFDGLILYRHFNTIPAFWFDTLSMGRMVMPIQVGGSLIALCAAFGRRAKKLGAALISTHNKYAEHQDPTLFAPAPGKRKNKKALWSKITKDELKALMAYAGDDTEDEWFLFDKLLPFIPHDEMRLIDQTIKMYTRPRLLLDKPMLLEIERRVLASKNVLMESIGANRAQMMSNELFADLLRDRGVTPPMKLNKDGELIYAFSKQDLDFKELLEHDNDEVAMLVAARLGVKTTIVETRARRMAMRADYGPQPIYLNHAGAKTLRWSGSDKINWQNMGRIDHDAKEKDSSLLFMREAIVAPPGYSLVIADQAQIEARLNAWQSGQRDIVEAFANKQDVYKLAASRIFGKPVDKITKAERFVGKVCVLLLGYQAGWARFAETLRIGQYGPPVNISDALAKDYHTAWRIANAYIVANWKVAQNAARSAFIGKIEAERGCITYKGVGDKGYTFLPNGTSLRYDGLELNDKNELSYITKHKPKKDGGVTIWRQKLYGGLIVENDTQALGRVIVADNILRIMDENKNAQLVLTTHDEVVLCVPSRSANKILKGVQKIMATSPSWAPDLPLAVDAHVSQRYNK